MSAAAGPLAPAVAARAGETGALCRRYRVRRLDLFGSAAAGREGTDSDLDFLVEFGELPEGGYADAYCGLLECRSAEATRRTVYEAADDGPHAPARESARC